MPTLRRLTAAFAAVSLGWGALAVGVSAPAVAEPASPAPSSVARAPQDPATYYAGTEGLSGATLAAKLHTIIDGHTELDYGTLWTALRRTDPDPANPDTALTDFYSGSSLVASNQCGSSCGATGWNREHTWPQSHGEFGTSRGIGTDLFHMRPEFGSTNSSRGNLDFDNTAPGTAVPNCALCRRDGDSFEPRAAVKGDLARGLFYMAVRYEGDDGRVNLKMNDLTCNGSGAPNMGKLSTLVAWSLGDPPDDLERARNDLIDSDYQHNRNPFIDHPEWVTSIFGNGVGLGPACGSTSGSDYVAGGGTTTNTAPTTAPMTASTPEDTAGAVTLSATDPDGDALTWSVTQTPVRGSASVTGSTLTYTPAPDASGTEQVGVRVSDGRGGTATTTVTITVTPVNDAPRARDLTTSTVRNTSVQIPLDGSDVDDTDLDYGTSTSPAHGTVSVVGDVATYQPATGYTGADTFTYVVRDPSGESSGPATVSITVTATQQPPTTTAASATTAEDQSVTFTLPATDPDGDPLTYAVPAQPAHGAVVLSGNQATYTPQADFHGADTFSWTVSDGVATTTGTASLTVTPVNDRPSAAALAATTSEDAGVAITLSGADVDAGDTLTYARVADGAHGTVTIVGAAATYAPDPGWSGTDTFTYTASDGALTSAPATVTVTVTPVNDAPSVAATTLSTTAGSPVTATLVTADPDGDALAISSVTAPEHGTVTYSGLAVTYTPATRSGAESFVVTVSDGQGGTATAQVDVDITARSAQLQVTTPAATRGKPVTTTITATGPTGPVPSGAVTLYGSGGAVLGTTALGDDGTATVAWVPGRAGATSLAAIYGGDELFEPATSSVATLTVARSAARLGFTAGTLKRGQPGVLKVSVRTVADVAATGRITLTVGTKKLTATATRGVATFRIARLPRAAKLTVAARYAGDAQYAVGAATHTYTIRR